MNPQYIAPQAGGGFGGPHQGFVSQPGYSPLAPPQQGPPSQQSYSGMKSFITDFAFTKN